MRASTSARVAPPTLQSSRRCAHLFQQLEPTAVQELVGSDRSTLARVIPELLDAGEAQDVGLRSGPMAQTRLFDRLVGVLDRASSAEPLVFELEDIHWADPSTRAFLQYLVANTTSAGLLVIATFRTEEAGRDHPIASVLRQLDRDPAVTRISLRPFDTAELREQLHGILGEPPTDRLLAAINARSEGNALFAEELVATGEPRPRAAVLDRRRATVSDRGPLARHPARTSRRLRSRTDGFLSRSALGNGPPR